MILSVLIVLLGIAVVRHFNVHDFCIIKPSVLYTSGQPRGMDYYRLVYKYHLTTIINIRPVSEHLAENWNTEEMEWVRTNNVSYFHMPILRGMYFPDAQTQEKFFAIMEDKGNLPVLLHGGDSDDKRVAMLVAAWARKKQGYSEQQTIEAVKKIIDDRELTEDEIQYIRCPGP